MSIFYVTRHGVVVAALAALGVAAAIAQPGEAARSAPGSLTCDIEVSRSGGMVELQALVSAPRETSGSYRLRVVKSGGGGSANIDQSGGFSVDGGSSVVSTVNLGGGGSYTAKLSVTADGRTIECSQRVGGAI
jgi:hypothetical protein